MEAIVDYRVDVMKGIIEYKTNTSRWLRMPMTTDEGAAQFIRLAEHCGVKNIIFAHELVGMHFETVQFPEKDD